MNKLWPQSWIAALLLAVLGALARPAWADPPSRVMQLSHASGSVSFQPASTDDWLRATPNRPLVPGDALWLDDGARAELRTTGAALRLREHTGVEVLAMDDRIAQLRLSQGTLILSVRRIGAGQAIEIDTPNLAFRPDRPGVYRIDVPASGEWTDVTMRRGAARVFGEGRAFTLAEGRTLRFHGTDLADHDSYALAPRDHFDRWASERDRRWEASASARHVAPDLIGYEDLDEHGRWHRHPSYGMVWLPYRMAADWAPYRDGHWAWIEPWGWTWIDDAPWGFAPSHYGRWARVETAWAWVPGPPRLRPVYAPAVVQFVGSLGDVTASLTIGGVASVAWFALGPAEVYRPAYAVSPSYLRAVNLSNALIAPARITNRIDINVIQANVYVNVRHGGVVAMPVSDFAQSRPVAGVARRVAPRDLARVPVAAAPRLQPTLANVVGATQPARSRPPREVLERAVIARAAPPAALAPPLPGQARGKPVDQARAPVAGSGRTAGPPAVRVVQAPPAVPLPADRGRRDDRHAARRDARADERRAPPERAVPAPAPLPPGVHAGARAPDRPVLPPQASERAAEALQQARRRQDEEARRRQDEAPRPPSPGQRPHQADPAPPQARREPPPAAPREGPPRAEARAQPPRQLAPVQAPQPPQPRAGAGAEAPPPQGRAAPPRPEPRAESPRRLGVWAAELMTPRTG